MAIVRTARGTGTHNSAATTFTATPGSNLAAGAMAVLSMATDNAHSSGSAMTITVTDSKGNTWTVRQHPLVDPGAASAGSEGIIATTPQDGGALTTGDTITIHFGSDTPTAKAWTLDEVKSDQAGGVISYVTGNVGTSGTGTTSPTITTGSITKNNIVIGCVCIEAGTTETFTDDTDTSNGSWSASQSAKIGSTTSGQAVISQTKIVTATATQIYNPTLGILGDLCLAWVQLKEVVTVSGSLTADAILKKTQVFGQTTATAVQDDYGRTNASSWGNADVGGTWTTKVTAGTTWSTDGSVGKWTSTGTPGSDYAAIGSAVDPAAHYYGLLKVTSTLQAAVGRTGLGICIRRTAGSNAGLITGGYVLYLTWALAGSQADFQWYPASTGVPSSPIFKGTNGALAFWVRWEVWGQSPTNIRGKYWQDGTSEPGAWDFDTTDSTAADNTTPLNGPFENFIAPANANTTITWDALLVTSVVGVPGFTADAVLASAATHSGSFTADGVLKKSTSSTLTADSIISNIWDWTSPPANGALMLSLPTLTLISPNPGSYPGLFQIQLDTVNTFDSGNLKTYQVGDGLGLWEYFDGAGWVTLPSTGLDFQYRGNNVRFTVPDVLSTTTWYRRYRWQVHG